MSEPTSLGTQILSPGVGSRFPPPYSLPQASYRRPVHSNIGDGDACHVPTPPLMVNSNNAGPAPTSRSLAVSIPPPAPAHLALPPVPSPGGSSVSAQEDYIPILHQPAPKFGTTSAKTPTLVIVPPPSPSDDGFTPVTPSPSPRTKSFKRIRASQLPRDALGIATAGFTRKKSQRAVDEYEDTAPLSPPYENARTMSAQLAVKAKPKRKTILGVLEGWWDLGLLERGKSLRRK
ncbi:hypothetical protein F4808DRAFT_457812 [Astrocystis sublimbata]|nr:hypothetical protein F4808DRAFT_457812 [Astrocystis sublimbata]